jgi:hypothetical protein
LRIYYFLFKPFHFAKAISIPLIQCTPRC